LLVKAEFSHHNALITRPIGEENYLHSDAIVELHNCWSSLAGISLFGFIGMTYGNATTEIRYFLAYLTLFLIGVGSAGLHGTMHWVFQSSDGESPKFAPFVISHHASSLPQIYSKFSPPIAHTTQPIQKNCQ
jgi:hypothetical protein